MNEEFLERDYNINNIELASEKLYKGSIEEQQIAAEFLLRWKNSKSSIDNAIEVLNTSNCFYAKYTALVILLEFTKTKYCLLNNEDRIRFREIMINKLRENLDNKSLIVKFNEIIVNIGLFDWPEFFDEFPFKIYPNNLDFENIGNLNIFRLLISETLESQLINTTRRRVLLNAIIQGIDPILEILIPALSDSEKIKISIQVLSDLTKVVPVCYFLNDSILNTIYAAFQSFDTVHKECLKLAENIFIKSYEAEKYFYFFGPRVLQTACTIPYQSKQLSEFIVKFLIKYGNLIELIICNDSSVINVIEQFKKNNIDLEKFFNNFIQQYLYSLNSPLIFKRKKTLVWKLWNGILKRALSAIMDKKSSATIKVISSIIDQIVIYLFNCVSYANNDGVIKDKNVYECITMLYLCDQKLIINFLMHNNLSISTNYVLGILCSTFTKEVEIKVYEKQFFKILNEISFFEEDTNFIASGIFALSRCIHYLEKDQEALSGLTKALISCLEYNNEFIQMVSSKALNFLSLKFHKIFEVNDSKLLYYLLRNIDNYIKFNWGVKIFRILCREIQYHGDLTEHLTNLVFNNIQNFLENYPNIDLKQIQLTLYCLSYDSQSENGLGEIFLNIWDPLIELLKLFINIQIKNGDLIELIFLVLSVGITKSKYQDIKPIVLNILQIISSIPSLYSYTFFIIASTRNVHEEFEEMFQKINDEIIIPYLNGGYELEIDYYLMLSQFNSFNLMTNQILSSISCGILSMKPNINISSINCLIRIIQKLIEAENDEFNLTYRKCFISSIFSSMCDMLHIASFTQHVTLLQMFFKKSSDNAQLDIELFETIKSIIDEPEPNFFISFISEMNANFESFSKLSNIIKDFLGFVQRVTPLGLGEIETQLDEQDNDDEVIKDILSKTNESLKSEELEFNIDGLKNFKI